MQDHKMWAEIARSKTMYMLEYALNDLREVMHIHKDNKHYMAKCHAERDAILTEISRRMNYA